MLVIAARVPKMNYHDLRHTSAPPLPAEGVHPKIVQERGGHPGISMTLNGNSHEPPRCRG
jgi:integrase